MNVLNTNNTTTNNNNNNNKSWILRRPFRNWHSDRLLLEESSNDSINFT